ncbi:MAG: hypothetical protein JNK27_12735 [Chitinophagaceae bacterium]|nr:hypothetical protein [Chitinophagaceae bacterium]
MKEVHWTYSRKEWRTYMCKVAAKRNFFFRTWKKFTLLFLSDVPEVKINSERILVGSQLWKFDNNAGQLKNIELREEGEVNIFTILFMKQQGTLRNNEISIPVPKGKLREAFTLQDAMLNSNSAQGR